MSNVIRGIDRGTRTVDHVEVRLTELIWNDDGRCFEVHRTDTDVDLADVCFDTWPTDEQIAVLVREHDGYWSCPGCGAAITSSRGDLITDHIRDCGPTGRNGEASRDDRCGNPV
ncbi:hypothetical protein EDC02_2189 [Micromonospora sp. Llam0]|uniref:hypothetical protein n=1 Tax=Micromonospora sp. Llam0 TaxID=2485143 RepID=UPI000FB30C2D|nr:hypothetical protein [Micromonospora sp. Llam0]ROO60328.1 hypothetical protein EDC02_2189 [Micromonospora sp. Llam0]